MLAVTRPRSPQNLRAPTGRGDFVCPAYWVVAAALLVAALFGASLGQPQAVGAATILFIGGGMPHGAYDIALLRRANSIGHLEVVLATGCYVAIAIFMVMLWSGLPLVALVVFLIAAAVHFGEDWQILDEPLLRFAAGAAVIVAATIGHPADVSALFVEMSDTRATVFAQIITAAAPVILLVTIVGIVVAWRDGSRQWATAMALCLGLLIILPPVAGFALFFVFLHSPRHLAQTRILLPEMTFTRWLMTGAVLSGVAILGWIGLQRLLPTHLNATLPAQAFQLIASVALPHLLFSRWLEKRLDQAKHPYPTRKMKSGLKPLPASSIKAASEI